MKYIFLNYNPKNCIKEVYFYVKKIAIRLSSKCILMLKKRHLEMVKSNDLKKETRFGNITFGRKANCIYIQLQ